MKTARVVYRPEALASLERIYCYVAEKSQDYGVAEGFVQRLMARCRSIGNAPYGGRPRDDLEPGLRTIPFERRAVIAYVVSDVVEITDVFYGGRDYEALYHPGKAGEASSDE